MRQPRLPLVHTPCGAVVRIVSRTARLRAIAYGLVTGAALVTAPFTVCAVDAVYPPGQYELAWQTVMPHLDEMRRITDRETACLDGDPQGLFPVLRQPALRGCRLQPLDGGRWQLTCRSAAVASGSATLENTGAGISGDLAIKMGGKNMTFSQHVTATRRGSCTSR
ncbi:MAG: hypothetical protein RLW61_03110 [Gammaproteobacteria bacterium]